MRDEVVIGTRGSALALVQARATKKLLEEKFPKLVFREQIIRTTGDRRTDVALADVAKTEGTFDKGVFIKELEEALEAKEIDIAVHSLKDMPTVLERQFSLGAVLERAPVRDVLLTKSSGGMDNLIEGSKVGTSSVRRAEQIKHLRNDLSVHDIRGNVPTRIKKLAEGSEYDGILLAEAGLVRLGYLSAEDFSQNNTELNEFPGIWAERLCEETFPPAAGQGAIGLEMRAGEEEIKVLLAALNHKETWIRVGVEREFLRLLNGGCHTPVGVSSRLSDGKISLSALVFPDGGGVPRRGSAEGTDVEGVAQAVFKNLR